LQALTSWNSLFASHEISILKREFEHGVFFKAPHGRQAMSLERTKLGREVKDASKTVVPGGVSKFDQ